MRVTDGRSFFKAMDKDNSGSLDVAEVARGLKRLGIEASVTWKSVDQMWCHRDNGVRETQIPKSGLRSNF